MNMRITSLGFHEHHLVTHNPIVFPENSIKANNYYINK